MRREKTWDKNIQLLLVAIIAFNILPHMMEIPIWASAISYFLLGWKTLVLTRGLERPPSPLLWLVSIGCAIGVFFEYRTIVGHEAASALLVTLASAKLLETNRYRDAMFVICTSFFLLMAHLLSSQTLLSTLFMGFDVLLITSLMFQLHKQDRRASPRSYRPVMRLLVLAIPVWIFLFFAFPRFSSGLWRFQSAPEAGSGFSDNLDPGGIESLTDSQEPAFRATFAGARPPLDQLYWRGSVLTTGDGLRWTKAKVKSNFLATDALVDRNESSVLTEYQVFLEPRFRTWLFVLDYPQTFSPSTRLIQHGVRARSGLVYETQRPLVARAVYSAGSRRPGDIGPKQTLTIEERDELLKLPEKLDPRVSALAASWKAESADQTAERGLDWFVSEKFRYTKSPGALSGQTGSEQLTHFLFERKLGFCEHYAAAFATVLRAAGVPTRVAIGFHGGLRNEYGGYWLVRDLDAHAWTEIWREEARSETEVTGRWVRVDPTSVIAPLRLRLGGEYNLLSSTELQANLDPAQFEAQFSARTSSLYWRSQAAWDAVQMRWNSFLNDYDFEFQKSFFEKLGLTEVTRLFLFGLVSLGILFFIVGLSLALRRRAHRVDPILNVWLKFCSKLERAGLERDPNEGPLDFKERATAKFPRASGAITEVANQFMELRYGKDTDDSKQRLQQFRQSVRRFSIRDNS